MTAGISGRRVLVALWGAALESARRLVPTQPSSTSPCRGVPVSRVLFQVVHFPKPEHRDDMIAAMDVIRQKSAHIEGLDEIGAFSEPDGSRIVAISVWESPEAMQAGMGELFASVGDLPLDRWETRPYESATLTQVA
jgi:quinol monooxygenase YgiN